MGAAALVAALVAAALEHAALEVSGRCHLALHMAGGSVGVAALEVLVLPPPVAPCHAAL